MKTDKPDVLIIGGPAQLIPSGGTVAIRHEPFTFSGLSLAYRLLPEADTVVILPDTSLYSAMPAVKDFERFDVEGRLNPVISGLGLLEPMRQVTKLMSVKSVDHTISDKKTVTDQARLSLSRIPEPKKPEFIRRAAHVFLGLVLDRTFNVVNGGGSVFLLVPEEYSTQPPEDKAIIADIAPGLFVGHDSTWSSIISGESAWLLEGSKSDLWFNFSDDYKEMLEGNYVSIPDPVPRPDNFLKLLPHDARVSICAGAVDRAGQRRVLSLRWGKGEFIIAPAVCLPALLQRVANDMRAEVVAVTTNGKPVATGSTGVEGKKPRRTWPTLPKIKKENAYRIWESFKNSENGQPEYANCFAVNEQRLKELGIESDRHFEAVCDNVVKNKKNAAKRAEKANRR